MAPSSAPPERRLMEKKFRAIELLTVAEVASTLRVSRMTVYRKVHSGELPAVHFGRSFRIPVTALEAYLPEQTVPPDNEEAE